MLSREKSKTVFFFKIRKSLPFLHNNLKWRAKFQISRLHIHDSDWLSFMHISGYKYKIRLVSRLRKRVDQALISISTILKFPALIFQFVVSLESDLRISTAAKHKVIIRIKQPWKTTIYINNQRMVSKVLLSIGTCHLYHGESLEITRPFKNKEFKNL